ncbi:MAG: exosortase family protein XrtF, partial [Algoriella sp.]|nr:exosortase family protein XrtF [Algoriella sp.]
NFKQTFLFIVTGLAALFVMNISRIMLLNYIFRYHHEYGKIAHDYLFPAIIYGSIVILWIVWIKFFVTKYNKQNAK